MSAYTSRRKYRHKSKRGKFWASVYDLWHGDSNHNKPTITLLCVANGYDPIVVFHMMENCGYRFDMYWLEHGYKNSMEERERDFKRWKRWQSP